MTRTAEKLGIMGLRAPPYDAPHTNSTQIQLSYQFCLSSRLNDHEARICFAGMYKQTRSNNPSPTPNPPEVTGVLAHLIGSDDNDGMPWPCQVQVPCDRGLRLSPCHLHVVSSIHDPCRVDAVT
jgi:hypothetical protein